MRATGSLFCCEETATWHVVVISKQESLNLYWLYLRYGKAESFGAPGLMCSVAERQTIRGVYSDETCVPYLFT